MPSSPADCERSMAQLCGSCGTACAAGGSRCPACGRTVATSAAGIPAIGPEQPGGYAVSRGRVALLAALACLVLLALGASVWFFAFPSSGFGQPALIIPTPTLPTFGQPGASPAVSPGLLTPGVPPTAQTSATSGSQGPGGGGVPSATSPASATASPVHLSPSPTVAQTPVVPIPTITPVSGGG